MKSVDKRGTDLNLSPLKCFPIGLVAVLWLFASACALAQPPEHWRSAAYAYNARGTDVQMLLRDFADSFAVRLQASPLIEGTLDGWLRADNAVEFLDRLAVKYKLQWFIYNDVLYISPISDNVVKRIEVPQDGALDLKRAMKGLGLFEEKFGWGELSDEGAILISGPEAYVSLVQSLVKTKPQDKQGKKTGGNEEVMVFPLKHASVDDREIYIREQRTVIPGVASVLRNLLEKKRATASPLGANDSMETLRAMQDSAEARIAKSPWQREAAGLADEPARRSEGVRVEADVRTNSVLIHDQKSRRAYYAKLIETLDVPQNLIEIQAIIIDIDRSRLKELGIDWQAFNDGRSAAVNVSGMGQNPVQQFENGSATMLISDFGRFYASLRMLESKGEASVIANPSVLTLENQPAVIDLSETTYIETVGERVANVLPVTAGTMLRVTPRQVRDSENPRIQLVVDIEDGRIIQPTSGDIPRVQRNSISTKAVIDQDYSLVVGGYHLQARKQSTNRVPFISDIPLLGDLFTSVSDDISHRERLFILTPHVSGYQHRASAYADAASQETVDTAVENVQVRWQRSSQDVMERVQSLFRHLAQEQLPQGYKLAEWKQSIHCRQTSLKFDFRKGRRVLGQGLDVRIGTVENIGSDLVQVDEASCDGKDVIAVAVWPETTLQRRQKAEVFVALWPGEQSGTRLPSLLK